MKEAINRLLTLKCDHKLKLTEGIGPPEVYGFADGGELVHGAAILLRWMLCEGSHQCALVVVRPFVAPLKERTIARLERLGYVVLTRIYITYQEVLALVNLNVYDKTFWVDFRTFLMWSRTPPRESRLSSYCRNERNIEITTFQLYQVQV